MDRAIQLLYVVLDCAVTLKNMGAIERHFASLTPIDQIVKQYQTLDKIEKTSLAAVVGLPYDERLKKALFLFVTALPILFLCSCSNKSKNAAQMDVDFEWQQIDKGAQELYERKL